jgi:hypothetical protein
MKRLTDPLRGVRQARPSRVAPAVRRSGLTDMQANILQALRETGKELIAKQIAPLAGHKNDGYFRGVLRGLLRDGYLQRGVNGYRLPD